MSIGSGEQVLNEAGVRKSCSADGDLIPGLKPSCQRHRLVPCIRVYRVLLQGHNRTYCSPVALLSGKMNTVNNLS
jgi:hypothetical protein